MITVEKILFLKRILIFKSLSTQELRVIADVTAEEELSAGEVLFSEGQQGDCMFFVVEGRVKIFTGTPPKIKPLATFEGGDFFGEMGLYDDKPRAASAMAVDDSRLLILRKADFCELIAEYPEVALGIMKELNQRIRATNLKLNNVESKLLDSTGNIYTREYFLECISTELLKAKKNDVPVSFVLVRVRAVPGAEPATTEEQVRELLVADLGRILTQHQRPNDLSARFRPDKLVTMLGEANRGGAQAFQRRVQKDFETHLTSFYETCNPKFEVAFSIFCFPEDTNEREAMIGLLERV